MGTKYIAFCSVDYTEFTSRNVKMPTTKVFTSRPLDSKEQADEWIKSQIEKYPDSSVNSYAPGFKYYLNTGLVEYNPEVSSNFELILKMLTTKIDA